MSFIRINLNLLAIGCAFLFLTIHASPDLMFNGKPIPKKLTLESFNNPFEAKEHDLCGPGRKPEDIHLVCDQHQVLDPEDAATLEFTISELNKKRQLKTCPFWYPLISGSCEPLKIGVSLIRTTMDIEKSNHIQSIATDMVPAWHMNDSNSMLVVMAFQHNTSTDNAEYSRSALRVTDNNLVIGDWNGKVNCEEELDKNFKREGRIHEMKNKNLNSVFIKFLTCVNNVATVERRDLSMEVRLGVAAGAIVLILLLCLCCFCVFRKR
eukprot:49169_1